MAVLECDLSDAPATCAMVDLLARLEVALRRQGCDLRLQHASAELVDLVVFMGLSDVLRVELERKAEQREEDLRLEEERQLDDLPVGDLDHL
jgi:hypothetical protein